MNTFGPDPRNNPAAADVVKKFRDAGFEPEAYTLYCYAAMQVLAQAIEKTGRPTTRRRSPRRSSPAAPGRLFSAS